jgi:glycosyltransferase involved in cell wall biosynthesis
MNRLRILWFNWRCWLNPAMGGAEVFTREVLTRWVKEGHEATLFASEFPGCKKEEVLDGVKIYRSGSRLSVYSNAKKFYKKKFRAEKFDLIIDEINTVPFFAHKFTDNGEKIIALIHQLAKEYWFYEMPFPLSYLGYYYLEEKWLREYINVPTVTVSKSTMDDLITLGFQNVSIVPEGLNFHSLDNLPKKDTKPIIVYAGRLKSTKRPDHAIKAFKQVKKVLPTAELWVFGNGPLRKKLEKAAGDGVHFFGSLSNNERRALIEKSWVLVNPGIREGWGLNIIEANAVGVPAVAYDVPGLRDSIIDGKTGLLADAGDVDALAGKIICLLKDDSLREKLSKNALVFSRGFNWENTANAFQNVVDGQK